MASPSSGKSLDEYWQEFAEIEQNKSEEDEDEEQSKTPDEGEVEAQWLTDAGYGFIVSKFSDGRDLSDDELEALTSSLTRHQAEAVKKRVDTLSSTMRKKKGANKMHVKDIFPTPASPEPPSPSSPTSPSVFPSGADNTPAWQRPPGFLGRNRGGYSLENAVPEPPRSMEQAVEALSFKERGTFVRPAARRTTSNRSMGPLPVISDSDISVDFHLEEKDNQILNRQPKPDPHKVDLPAFEAKHDPLGITLIGDLAETDMPKIRSLALIELTALFDLYEITYSRPKRKKKPKEHGLFGVPLQVLVEQDQKRDPSVKVPLIFQAMVSYLEKEALEVEGILRVPGAVTRVKQLRHELEEKFYAGTFNWSEVTPNDCAALLKQFLRELPIPLLTYDYLEAFPQVEHIPKTLEQLKALNLLILLLPTEHRDMLRVLLLFLRNIVSHSNHNKMGLNNISMIMAPNLFLAPSPKGKSKAGDQLELAKAANTLSVVKMLIHYQDVLWVIPSSFLTQIRHQYKTEASRKSRDKMRLWKKKDRSEPYKKTSSDLETQNGVIRVQAPDLTKSSCLIQLDEQMTAGDIVAKFRRDYGAAGMRPERGGQKNSAGDAHMFNNPNNAQFADDKAFLFEVGGNIGERCLDPQTRMMQLYQINPTADWVIRVNVNR
ncbi:hypothetical protein BaRGS_00019317 [Batillaria attramentaria]|uniref:Rho-GAP domain-containing protein n=1 Tax=Batillaria attramentaria TaxID=370345 RepID=A0ABD0KR40_9CAEN